MSSSTAIACAKCKKPATQTCSGCKGGFNVRFEYTSTNYCSKTCQAKDRPTHKTHCKGTVYRYQLTKVAAFVEVVYGKVRESFFYSNVTEIIDGKDHFSIKTGADIEDTILFDFPKHLLKSERADRDVEDFLCSAFGGPAALAMMHSIFEEALKGSYYKIHEVEVILKPNELIKNRVTGAPLPDRTSKLLKIDLKDGNSYALDIVALQRGHFGPFMEWSNYMSEIAESIVSLDGFGTESNRDHNELLAYRAFSLLGWDFPKGKYNLIRLAEISAGLAVTCCVEAVVKSQAKSLADSLAGKDMASMQQIAVWRQSITDRLCALAKWLKADDQRNARAGDPYCFEVFFATSGDPIFKAAFQDHLLEARAATLELAANPEYLAALKLRYQRLSNRS